MFNQKYLKFIALLFCGITVFFIASMIFYSERPYAVAHPYQRWQIARETSYSSFLSENTTIEISRITATSIHLRAYSNLDFRLYYSNLSVIEFFDGEYWRVIPNRPRPGGDIPVPLFIRDRSIRPGENSINISLTELAVPLIAGELYRVRLSVFVFIIDDEEDEIVYSANHDFITEFIW